MATRSAVVSVRDLDKSISRAVALAAKRHGVKLGSDNIISNWEILGRILRELNRVGANGPLEVAASVARGAGLRGTPVATKIGRDILVGVIPRDLNMRF